MVGGKLVWIFKIFLIYLTLCEGEINITEYKRMPALYQFDNYDDCINRKEFEAGYPAKYCMVFVQIKPDIKSSVWQQIVTMRPDKFKFRHDYIFRGLCMESCKDLLNENKTGLHNELIINEQTQMFQRFYNTKLDHLMRHHYQKEIHQCVNREYEEKYNLSAKTFVNFCIDPQQSREKDIYYSLVIFLIILFILINTLSTIYDAKLKSQQLKPDDIHNYYDGRHREKVHRYLTAFSLQRTYKHLVAPNKGDIGCDLSFLDGFRSILCLLIVYEHGHLLGFFHIENTELVESWWQQLASRLLIHALIWLELFFVLSGLLLYVKFEKSQYINPSSSFKDCVHVFIRLILSRYLRFLPSLVFIIIITINTNCYHGNNSLARSVIDTNCYDCREFWWQIIFMIRNYYMGDACLMHTWYISAEFQLYGLFLIILIIMAKYPKSRVVTLTIVAIVAAIINFGVNYVLKLESISAIVPEKFRYFYFYNIRTSNHIYFSTYTNIHSFLLGIICGFIYMKYLRKNPKNKMYLGKILQKSPYIGWAAILAILYLGTTIIDHKETTIWTAAYGLLHRHVGLAIVAVVVILRGMCKGGGFLNYAPLRFLSRISFQVYLCHVVVYYNLLAYFSQPIHLTYTFQSTFSILMYVIASLIAFVVALCVEYPVAEVINIIDIEKKIKQIKTS